MNKHIYLIIALLACVGIASAQNAPAWRWAKSDTSASIGINPSFLKGVAAAGTNRALWGYLKNKKTTYGQSAYGDCVVNEYDTAGTITGTTIITGKIALTSMEADSAGNWYVVATIYDSMRFANNQLFTTNIFAGESNNYIFRLHAGTLAPDWCRKIGTDYQTTVRCLTVNRNKAYLVTDSGFVSRVWSIDPATGAGIQLLTQQGQSQISDMRADNAGNIYIAGSCVSQFSGLSFNGIQSIPPGSNTYPAYIVRYRSNGQHDWHLWMTDNTCVVRKLTIAANDLIYYSGAVHDTMTFGGFHVAKPKWVYNFMVARMDSTGTVAWVRQEKDTLAGDARLDEVAHAAVSSDSSITIFPTLRGYLDWGNGITNTVPVQGQAALVHYKANGDVQWTKGIGGLVTYAQYLAGNGTDVWVAGIGRDSFNYHFDGITTPAALQYPPYFARLYTGAKAASGNPSAVATVSELNLVVQPNPATNSLMISGLQQAGGNVSITLSDLTGRAVYQNQTPAGSNTVSLDVSTLARGMYLLQARGNNVRYISRVVLR